MCGIVAMFSKGEPISTEALAKATQRLSYRGPDKQCQWIAAHQQVGLGHTRLSIIDLTTGDQPITNEDSQLHVIVNGEFYDFERIQGELKQKGHRLSTHSDSEIVLHLYEEFGTQCLNHLRGEFAFILWDESKQLLFAARDRFGIKPLFYTIVGDILYLASEAKALFAAGVPARWDHESFFQQLFLYANQDRTLFAGVYQVPPGHYLLGTRHSVKLVRYWDLDYPRDDDSKPRSTNTEYIEQIRHKLEEAVKIRLRADVPVGSFLSGGLDSSAVLGIAAKHSSQTVRAFTVTFDEAGYDEEAIARETAARVGVDFQPILLKQSDFADHITDAIWHAETLDTNSRGVARYLQSRVVHDSGYKVILSGDGSDEIFAGYGHVKQDLRLNHTKQKLENTLPNSTPVFLASVQQTLGFVPSWLKNVAVDRAFFPILLAPDYALKFAKQDVYRLFLEQFDFPGQLAGRNPIIQSLYLWSKSILPNYSLFAERLEMAHAVEIRVPFLDHHLFELVREMPVSLLTHGMQEKYLLREAARPFLTDTVYHRPKHPFTAPPATLTSNNRLYTLMQESLRSSAMASIPFFDQKTVIALLDKLPTMTERQRIALDSTLLILLSTYILHTQYHL
ncbi:MAG: asparagine synthase (glutamine-hydrolyzing) [Pelatocladus maniniholoensis HA4357-MV3]|jgi:asparagine synthase (glutamine-hydrolysing)|uniref:asparagine synthase (glutamine-hydrolyzing) n=1 Tax=Pelatocladus maniniholoensis HA4357-MV3 TaxID=1117104 RepID=A0A9E3HFE4_9NOST|nr:asparagine synthase (glutamine-hydrolyzing) [Pelatocladus maniniholoensis HA4357-MV3]